MAQLWGMEPTAEEIRKWLRNVIAETGMTPTEIARKSGLSPSTVLRFLSGKGGMLQFRSAAQIAHATGKKLPMSPEPAAAAKPGLSDIEGMPFLYDIQGGDEARLGRAIKELIGGRPAADPWLLTSSVMEDAGYMPGDILIVDLNAEPERGDCVCAQLYRWQVGTAETIFRIYEEPYLLAATRHPDLRKPLLVDNDRVVIKGVVTEILRARKRLPTTGD